MNNLKDFLKGKYKTEFLNKILEFSEKNFETENILKEINFSGKFLKINEINNKLGNNFDLIITDFKEKKELKKLLSNNGEILFIKENGDFENFKNEEISKEFILEICEKINLEKNEINLDNILQKILKSGKFIFNQIPKKALILDKYHNLLENGEIKKNENLEKILIRKKIRSLSGVLPITLMTKPFPCPGDCIFCPDDTKMPKSYMSEETTSQRALRQEFSAYDQVIDRLKSAKKMGHNSEKAEIIILGGTFPAYPKKYQEIFVKGIFKALNGIDKNEEISLEKLHKINETAENKCVGLSVEIRPDTDSNETLSFLRKLGITRIEMGVQSLNNEVLKLNRRGHKIEEVQKATKNLKQFGFKVMYHMMMGLPGSSEIIDKKSFKEIFSEKYYHPDQLKIYPCLVLKGTELAKRQKELNYKAFGDEEIIKMTKYIKKECIPFYTRIARITRDVPAPLILNGSKSSNIRQKIEEELKKEKISCKCIRCREIKDENFSDFSIYFEEIKLENAKEFYIEIKSEKGKCLGLIRLYLPEKNTTNFESLENKGIIRELHIYGKLKSMKKSEEKGQKNFAQHLGFGEILIKKAEEIAKKEGKKGMAIISAIGTRGYYKKFGYEEIETYMSKEF